MITDMINWFKKTSLIERMIMGVILSMLLIMVSCGGDNTPPQQPIAYSAPQVSLPPPTLMPDQMSVEPPPVIVNNTGQDSTITNMLLGGLVGHAIGSNMGGRNNIPPPQVVHTRKRVVYRPRDVSTGRAKPPYTLPKVPRVVRRSRASSYRGYRKYKR